MKANRAKVIAVRPAAAVAAVLILGASSACRRGVSARETAPVAARSAMHEATGPGSERLAGRAERPFPQPVSLPDLSQVEPSVRAQLKATFDRVTRRQEAPDTVPADLAEAYGDLGKLLLAARVPDQAEPCFVNAQSLAAQDRRWPYYLGHIYRTRGTLDPAIAAFRRAVELAPHDVPALVWLAELQLAAGRPEAAVPLFSKALEFDAGRLSGRFGLGRAALAVRDYARAVEHLEAALSLQPKATAVHYPLALAYRGLGDTRKAEAHARQPPGVEIAPADPLMDDVRGLLRSTVSYELVGTRALNAGAWTEAIEAFRAGLVLEPSNPALTHKLGTALFLSGDINGAKATFERLIRTGPTYAKAHYSLGMLLAEEGKSEAAIARLSAAVSHEPTYVEAHVSLAELLRRRGRLVEAVTHYDQALALDPRLPEAALGRALTLIRGGRYAEAVERLRQARRIHPEAPWFAHALARLLAAAPDDRVRDGRQAVAVMESLGPDDQRLDFGETMSMALAEVGRYQDAVRWQRAAVALARQAGQAEQAVRMGERLERYESGRPSRSPWRPEELQ